MNELKIQRDGADLGPYSHDKAQGLIASRQLLATDLAWHDGMTDWAPLSSLPEFSSLFSAPPASSVSTLQAEAAALTGEAVTAGAGSMAKREVRLIAAMIDVGLYVLVGVIGGLFPGWLGWVLWGLFVTAQAVLLVKRGQTLGKLLQGIKIADYRTSDRTGMARLLLVRTGIPWAIAEFPTLLENLSAFLILIGALESSAIGVTGGLIGLGVAGFVGTFGSLFLLIDILFIYSVDRRCLHDRMAGTSVINARERTLGDKIIYWVVVALLLAVVIGGAAMIGTGAMSI